MKITEVSVRRPVTILMLILAVIALSLFSLSKLSVDLMPDIEFPVITVMTQNTGAGPKEIEENITQKIEQAVGTVNNIENIKSRSLEGLSIVTIEFSWGTNMAEASSDVREKLDLVIDKLPSTATRPTTFKFDASMIPVYIFSITGLDLAKAKKYGEDVIKPLLEQLDGVSSVNIEGGRDEEIQIFLNSAKMNALGLTFDDLTRIISAENVNMPAGSIKVGYDDYTLRIKGEFQDLEEIKNTIISVKGAYSQKPVFLKDIADVKRGFADREQIRTLDTSEAVVGICYKRSGANTVEVADRIINKLIDFERIKPKNIKINKIFSGGDYIQQSIGNLTSSAYNAGLLAIIVVFIFLRSIRPTLIVGLAIPISIIATFLLMYAANMTLNLMSFGGLALGVGMLVDNAIVVIENIYRHRTLGESPYNAAIIGTEEVGLAITASTFTTIVVFLPLMFTEGIAGEFFKEMSLTITFSLLASLFVAITIIPMFASKLFKEGFSLDNVEYRIKFFNKILNLIKRGLDNLTQKYSTLLEWALYKRKTVVFGIVILFFFSLFIFGFVQKGFMSQSNNDMIQFVIELKEGTRLEVTEQLAYQVAEKIKKSLEDVHVVITVIGGGKKSFVSAVRGTASNKISGSIRLKDPQFRKYSTVDNLSKAREILTGIPGAKVKFTQPSMVQSNKSPLEVEVRGNDIDTIYQVAKEIKNIMEKNFSEELKDIDISRTDGSYEYVINIDRVKAATIGLNVYTISSTLLAALSGITATQYRFKGEETDVIVRLREEDRLTLDDIKNIRIKSPFGISVPLSKVVTITRELSPSVIERKNQQRVVYVKANNQEGVGLVNVVEKLREYIVSNIVLPEGVTILYGGNYEDTQSSFADLSLAFLLGILLVYMIMAAQFESLLDPFLILFTIPLSLIGVIWLLFLTGTEFNVVGFIGAIILLGIVVNNGIVLIDYTKQLREKHGFGLFEAIIEAGKTRLRPVLMTSLTTIVGMMPLALKTGSGSEVKPMAVTIIGGLTVSTILTLIFLPTLYSIVESYIIRRRREKLEGK
ncbi:MAG TPA: efflux RND transporter permease subunit [Spirochaetota bacterium]|nr:efflux RND transporter permease subunit [Spirochaetota bacterium]HOM37651.1 efflux RND transporter permease subunit [Spirochaetota bacterium]HPQ49609.1 efflux RND transporter permease subunit [Spirochaetota bacterium]